MARTLLATAALAACLVVAPPRTACGEDALTEEHTEALAWLDTLGLPAVDDLPFVRCTATFPGIEKFPQVTYGFLIADTPEEVSLVADWLGVATFPRETWDVEVERPDLAETAADLVERLAADPEADEDLDLPVSPGRGVFGSPNDLPLRAKLAALARGCAAQGLEAEAARLLTVADDSVRSWTKTPEGASLARKLQADLDEPFMWRTVLLFGYHETPRPEILARYRTYLRCFPEGRYRERAEHAVETLETMVEEDARHAEEARPFDELTEREQIAELIFRLRDQRGEQWSQPGAPHFLDDPYEEGGPLPPVARLREYGKAAVPQLIEALDDPRFTRCVGFHRNFYFSHYVPRVGDAALRVLQEIADTQFYVRRSTSGSMWKDGESANVRSRVELWWKRVNEGGELEDRLYLVRLGGTNSARALRWVIEHAPERAVEAAREGLRAASEGRFVSGIVQELRALETPEATALLVEALDDSRSRAARVIAAGELIERGVPEGMTAAEREWAACTGSLGISFEDEFAASLLLRHGADDRVAALAADYRSLSDAQRGALVRALRDFRGTTDEITPVRRRLLEDVLVAALDDHAPCGSTSSTVGSWDVYRSDMAGSTLRKMLGIDSVPVVPPKNLLERRDWLHAIEDAVLAARGMPPPERPAPAPAVSPPAEAVVHAFRPDPHGVALLEPAVAAAEALVGQPPDRQRLRALHDVLLADVSYRRGSAEIRLLRRPGRQIVLEIRRSLEPVEGLTWRSGLKVQVGDEDVRSEGTFYGGTVEKDYPPGNVDVWLDTIELALAHERAGEAPLFAELVVAHE